MILSRYTIHNIDNEVVQVPDEALFLLPEKILQFGSGEWLRSLPDYVVNEANQQGMFNGRIVVVESAQAQVDAFNKQDCLYTVAVCNNSCITEQSINASISRVLYAADEWQQVLECAHNPEMRVILSHTAAGELKLTGDDARLHPPKTFPGRLLAFLYERYRAFGGSRQSGMVIIPTEPITDNGRKLETVVFELAHLNGLEDSFIEWLEASNRFCNSTLSNPAAGGTDTVNRALVENAIGYTDRLLTIADKSRLWTIEGDDAIKKIISFALTNNGVNIIPGAPQHNAAKLSAP